MKRGRRAKEQTPFQPADGDQVAAIAFTSGSTGIPKGVVYTHRMFSAQIALLRDQFGIQAGEIDLATFPLFALFNPALGVTSVFPEMDFTRPGHVPPEKILGPLRNLAVTHMFGSPALLNQVGRYASDKGEKLPGLRRVLSAGAPVSPRILRTFQSLLRPQAEIHTPYGATEALPICSITARERLALPVPAKGGICVGRILPGIELDLIRITDEAIEQWSDDLKVNLGEIGEVVVRGDNVSKSYFAREDANRLAKIRDSQGDVRHRMGDVAYADEQGRIWFCGRKSQRVRVGEETLFTVACESLFNSHPSVYRTALVGVGQAPPQLPVLIVELDPESRSEPQDQIRRQLLELGRARGDTRLIQTILFHPSFPVDIRHNAKIFREKLALWAEEKLR